MYNLGFFYKIRSMKNSFLLFLLFNFLCLNNILSQNENDTSHKKNKIEKPILMGYDIKNKIPTNTTSLKVKIISKDKPFSGCNNEVIDMTGFKILEILGSGQGIQQSLNTSKTAFFIVPLHLKKSISMKKKESELYIYIERRLCEKANNKTYVVTKVN